jgi:hypothetical protein
VYANSPSWTAIHLGQFFGKALILAGLLVLFFTLDVSEGYPAGWGSSVPFRPVWRWH